MTRTPAPAPEHTPHRQRSRWDVLRWQAGYGTFGVPQAAAPIAFALIALPITGTAESGAALVLAMTAAQIVGAVPMSRLGRRFDGVRYLRVLIAVRTAALAAVTVLAAAQAPFALLVLAVVAAGAVNGAAYGYQRLLLNHLVEPRDLPRALGVAATLNEITFALAPVLASLLGAVSPVWAMAAVTVLGVGPLVLMPAVPEAHDLRVDEPARARRRIPRQAYVWLLCAAAGGGVVASVEVGAVSFALAFGLGPAWSFLFALVLCVGSVTGGVVVSVRNRMPRPWSVVTYLAATTAASALVLLGGHLATALAGAAVIGFFLPVLGTFYSLALDRLAPPDRRAELFALLRTATSLGVIVASGLLALLGLRATLAGTLVLLVCALGVTVAHTLLDARRQPTLDEASVP
ncbi:MFS transporter [Promicromonospora sp. NPDC052451]|uniref:MFS transporter n=1 Tax=Promicromonospora sp. NPDC052451 TaxID=3364407 RepID=UPI0037CC0BED